jgi:hypothetical protein
MICAPEAKTAQQNAPRVSGGFRALWACLEAGKQPKTSSGQKAGFDSAFRAKWGSTFRVQRFFFRDRI